MFKAVFCFIACVAVTTVLIPAAVETLLYRVGKTKGLSHQGTTIAAIAANTSSIHDLALVLIQAPGWAEVTRENPSVTQSILVGIQNRSDHDEVIDPDKHYGNGITTGIIRLKVTMIDDDDEGCRPAKVAFRPPAQIG